MGASRTALIRFWLFWGLMFPAIIVIAMACSCAVPSFVLRLAVSFSFSDSLAGTSMAVVAACWGGACATLFVANVRGSRIRPGFLALDTGLVLGALYYGLLVLPGMLEVFVSNGGILR